MGGFWNALGQVGEGLAQGVAKKTPLGQGIYSGVQGYLDSRSAPPNVSPDAMMDMGVASQNAPDAGTYARYNSPTTPGVATPVNPGGTGDVGAPAQAPWSPPSTTPAPQVTSDPGSDQSMAAGGNQSQWNQSGNGGGGALAAGAKIALGLKGGAIITEPTLARIGEHGPEAVVPLTPRATNKMQPDLLEGHITAPKVPGVRYSRYKSFAHQTY